MATSNGDNDLLETSRLAGLKQFLCDDVLDSANRNKRNREAKKLLCVIRQIRISFQQRYTELTRAREEALRAVQILAETSAYIEAWGDFRRQWSAPLDRLINSCHSLPAMPLTSATPGLPPNIAANCEKLNWLREQLSKIIVEASEFCDDTGALEGENGGGDSRF